MCYLKDDLIQFQLGTLVELLEMLDPNQKIFGLGDLHSYKGEYDDLEFQVTDEFRTVQSILEQCRDAIGKEFVDYSGGTGTVDESTWLWYGEYGMANGNKLCGFDIRGIPLIKN